MNKKLLICFLVFFPLNLLLPQKQEFQGKYFLGATGSYLLPVGGLAERMKPGLGGSFSFGKEVSPDWEWQGKFEYLTLTDVNQEKMVVRNKYTYNNVEREYDFPLNGIEMELTAYGATANAFWHVVSTDFFQANLNVGFGVIYWEYSRTAYKDSLYYQPTADTTLFGEYINVPAFEQNDWSGTFNLGLDFRVRLLEPVWFTVTANYKNIIGELWPFLKLDMENVSTLQFAEIRAGFAASF